MTTAPDYEPPDHNDIPLTAKSIISVIDQVRDKHTRPGPNGSVYCPDEADVLVLAADPIDEVVQRYVAARTQGAMADVVKRVEDGILIALEAVEKIAAGTWSATTGSGSAAQWFGRAESDWATSDCLRRQYELGPADPALARRLEDAALTLRVSELSPVLARKLHGTTAEAFVRWLGQHYLQALRAIDNAHPDNDRDVNRWRGHAEAYRSAAAQVAYVYDLPEGMVAFSTAKWRSEHGYGPAPLPVVSDG